MTLPKEHQQIDRSDWPAGPWDDEPEDRIEWRAYGLPCLMRRNHMGAWCGYAAVPPDHPYYSNGEDPEVAVHGGITYSGLCHGDICHVPLPGETDNVKWFGFDCGHAGDLTPHIARIFSIEEPPFADGWEYRNRDYVRQQTELLAEALQELR